MLDKQAREDQPPSLSDHKTKLYWPLHPAPFHEFLSMWSLILNWEHALTVQLPYPRSFELLDGNNLVNILNNLDSKTAQPKDSKLPLQLLHIPTKIREQEWYIKMWLEAEKQILNSNFSYRSEAKSLVVSIHWNSIQK